MAAQVVVDEQTTWVNDVAELPLMVPVAKLSAPRPTVTL
jgi:hypothetical protein